MRARPANPTGDTAGAAAALRPQLLAAQLWLPAGAQRARRGEGRATLCAGRTPLGSGCGPGEVLRPGQPRRADGKAGATNQRLAAFAAHSPLPQRRYDGRRSGDGAPGGYAAGRTTYSPYTKANFQF